jgi:hypothetical protein
VNEAIAAYTQHDAAVVVANLRERHDRTGKGEIRSTSVMIAGPDGKPTRSVGINEPFDVIVSYDARIPLHQVDVSVIIELMDGTRIATLDSGFKNQSFSIAKGTGQLACHVPGLPLRPDTYSVDVFLTGNHAFYDLVENAMSFDVAARDVYGTGRLPQHNQGTLVADYDWRKAGLLAAAKAV